jgi:hypothetical protein
MFEVGKYEKLGYELFLKYQDYQEKYHSLCNKYQISFLLGLINDFRFLDGRTINTVLEIGVYRGVTSLYMLKEGCKTVNFQLYGIELGGEVYFGEAVIQEATNEEQTHYHLYKNSTSFDIENYLLGKKLDMVFIDGGHSHPHPILDLIHIIPFLHSESIVMLHDVVDYMEPNAWGESYIYCNWTEEKYRTEKLNEGGEPVGKTSLGCIKIPTDKTLLYENLLRIIKIPFRASPWQFDEIYLGINENHLNRLKTFMDKYYDIDFTEKVFNLFQYNLNEYKENAWLYIHETKFFHYLYKHVRDEKHYKPENQGKYDNLYTLKVIQKIENAIKKLLKPIVYQIKNKK